MLQAVRNRGVAAALEFTERFDGVRPSSVRVPADALRTELQQLDPAVRAALEESIARVRRVHADQRRAEAAHGGDHETDEHEHRHQQPRTKTAR